MTIVTIKWGQRYPAFYVNSLFSAAQRFGLESAQHVCYTDDGAGLHPRIERRPLPELDLPEAFRWTFWRKLALFDPAIELEGPCLYFDLDVLVVGSLSPLVAGWNGRPRFIRNWVGPKTVQRGNYDRINSSVVLYDPRKCGEVLRRFHSERECILQEYSGDQGFLHDCLADQAEFFSKGLCVSFKRHCLAHFPLNLVSTPRIPAGAAVVIFHGKPDPHEAACGYSAGKWKHRCRPTSWVAAGLKEHENL